MADSDLNINVKTTPKDPFGSIFKSLSDINGEISGAISGFKAIGAAVAGVTAVAGAFDFILDSTREMEDLTKQFVRFTGSVEAAEAQLDALKDIKGPPLTELAEANRNLLAFGISVDKSVDVLSRLNDVAAGSGSKVADLSDIYGKIQQEGTLTAETFSKLSKQISGFGTDFAKALGVPLPALKKLATEGEISAEQVASAFQKLTNEGGKYFQAAETQSQTLTGALDELGDSTTDLAAEIGKTLTPTLTAFINELGSAAAESAKFLREASKSDQLTDAQREVGHLTAQLEALQNKLSDIESGNRNFGNFLDSIFGINKGADLDMTIKKINQLKEQIDILQKPEKDAARLAQIQKDEDAALEIRRKAGEAEQALRDERAKKIRDDEFKAAEARGAAIQAAGDNINKLIEQQNAARSSLQAAQAEKEKIEAQRAAEDAAEAAIIADRERAEGITIIRDQEAVARVEQQRETEDLLTQQRIDAAIQREAGVTTALAEANAARQELLGQYDEAEITRTTERETRLTEAQRKGEADRLKILKKAQDEEFAIEKITSDAKKKFDEQTYAGRVATAQAGLNALVSLQKTGNRDAFNIGKAAAIAQALVAIPTTAIEAYKSLAGIPVVGPALGAAAAAAAVVAGTAQVNQIRQQQPVGFAKGGKVEGTGNKDTVPALLSPGEVVVPKQNFAQLEENFARGAIADDQVQLLIQGNAIQAKILDQLTIGVVNEKLTRMVALLDDIRNQIEISNRSLITGAGSTDDLLVPEVIPIRPTQTDRNQRPRQRDRVGINSAR